MGLWSSIKGAAKSAWNGVKKAAKAVARGAVNIGRAVMSIVRRIVKVVDWIGSLFHIRPQKKLMLHLIVLRKGGKPVVPVTEVERWLEVAKTVLKERCNIDVIKPELSEDAKKRYYDAGVPTDFPFITVAADNAPADALSVPAEASSAWNSELDYYRCTSCLSVAPQPATRRQGAVDFLDRRAIQRPPGVEVVLRDRPDPDAFPANSRFPWRLLEDQQPGETPAFRFPCCQALSHGTACHTVYSKFKRVPTRDTMRSSAMRPRSVCMQMLVPAGI